MKFINIQKNLSDIEFEKLIEIKLNYKCEIFNNWENYFEEKSIYYVNICPKTMRSYYNIKDEQHFSGIVMLSYYIQSCKHKNYTQTVSSDYIGNFCNCSLNSS